MKKLILSVFLLLICYKVASANLKKDYGHGQITPSVRMLDMNYEKPRPSIQVAKEKTFYGEEEIVMNVIHLQIKRSGKTIEADSAEISSGIMEKAMDRDNSYMSPVYIQRNNGVYTMTVKFPNYAAYAKVPVVEHFWGLARTEKGEVGHLFFNSLSPWVCTDKKRGNYVGIIIYPNGSVKPLKEKDCSLKVGRHPELK